MIKRFLIVNTLGCLCKQVMWRVNGNIVRYISLGANCVAKKERNERDCIGDWGSRKILFKEVLKLVIRV